MRGVDVSPWTAPLDALFEGGDWTQLAVGDGGNEIGMGKLPAGTDRASTVPNGARDRLRHLVRSPRGRRRVELGRLRVDGGPCGLAA